MSILRNDVVEQGYSRLSDRAEGYSGRIDGGQPRPQPNLRGKIDEISTTFGNHTHIALAFASAIIELIGIKGLSGLKAQDATSLSRETVVSRGFLLYVL